MIQSAFIPADIIVSRAAVDLTGQRFGKLVSIRVTGKHESGALLWLCACDCGAEVTCKSSSLRSGKKHSCGCFRARSKNLRTAWNRGASYQIKGDDEVFASKKAWTNAAIKRFGNRCSECGWDDAPCDVHHRVPRREGGLNTIANAVVLCPNHHRVLHHLRGDFSMRAAA